MAAMGWGVYKLRAADRWFTSFVFGADAQYVTVGEAPDSALRAYRNGVTDELQRRGLAFVASRSWASGASSIYSGASYTCEVTDGVSFFGTKNAGFVCAPTSKVRAEQKKIGQLVARYEKATKKRADGLTFTDSTFKSAVKKYRKYRKTYLHAVKDGADFYIHYAKAPGKSARYVTHVKNGKQHRVKCRVYEKTKVASRAFAKDPCKRGKKNSTVRPK